MQSEAIQSQATRTQGALGEDLKHSRILIVDDELPNVHLLDRTLRRCGYTNVQSTADPREVVPLCQKELPDLLLLDLMMPHLDGYQVMEQLKQIVPVGATYPSWC